VHFYGSGDWCFVDFDKVKPFAEHFDECVFVGAKSKKPTPQMVVKRTEGIRLAKAECKLKNKWDRALWLLKK
jgi:hypothetical protein